MELDKSLRKQESWKEGVLQRPAERARVAYGSISTLERSFEVTGLITFSDFSNNELTKALETYKRVKTDIFQAQSSVMRNSYFGKRD